MNGVITTVDGFWDWLKANDADLFRDYKTLGETDTELRRSVRPRLIEVYEDATDRALYPVELVPNIRERFEHDRQDGYVRNIFTSAPRSTVQAQLRQFGVSVDEVTVLDDIKQFLGKPNLMKEDPEVFVGLSRLLRESGNIAATYVDDSAKRIASAAQANAQMAAEEILGINRLYHFDPKGEAKEVPQGYIRVATLMDVV